ncbi:hypothetical protein PS662_01613 [Pseudomonas fluorescens]|uniref:Sodium:proline symporter n=1 Tax=Pseudomonas fluorescens TaxID=294 RepID=A0A5E6RE45_PSEFL|nr:PepSY domain-containing protein [Pseudomonas fluorescens]VVM67224.1 hypothetical protein PS662_01613 [Pseudomonas fluorescens]
MKRYLYLWHRWLGIALCLFMTLWLVSGMVMLYVGYPKLTHEEHLAGLPKLSTANCCVSLETALAASTELSAPRSIKLVSVGNEPRYLLDFPGKAQVAINARNGQVVGPVDENAAIAVANAFAGDAQVSYLGLVQEDMWSHSRGLKQERPFHVVQVDDLQQQRLYVSQHNGRVMLDVTRTERIWNWLGAWLHWLYPLRGGVFDTWAADVVIYLSLAGTALAILGQAIGFLRWRFSKRYRSGSRSPYPTGFYHWHHITGLIFGMVLIAWIFSGLMSMRPWHLLDSQSELSRAAYYGAEMHAGEAALPIAEAISRFEQAGIKPRELEWRFVGGKGFLVAYDGAGNSLLMSIDGNAGPKARLPATLLIPSAEAMSPGTRVVHEWLTNYDFYYYARTQQSMSGNKNKRLPILRLRFDDPAGTWVHIDPNNGALIELLDQRGRVGRWVFNLLHSWDWLPLLERSVLREVLIIIFSLGGLAISVTGIVLSWRRMRHRRSRLKKIQPLLTCDDSAPPRV